MKAVHNWQFDERAKLFVRLSPVLKRISQDLNKRGFVLRKRRAFIIEPISKRVIPTL